MPTRKLALLALITVFSVSLAGCGGGGAKVEAVGTTTTVGQELQDLDAAYQKGLMSEKEYEKAKKAILNRYK